MQCANPDEKQALDTRTIQSQLMVAALSCNLKPEYDAMIIKFNDELKNNAKHLKSYFGHTHPKNSDHEMNRFITFLANESSNVSLKVNSARFCNWARNIFSKTRSAGKLSEITGNLPLTNIHKIQACD